MNRYTSIDTLGRPVNIWWPWGMDLKWAVTITPAEDLEYSLSGKEITLIIQKKTDATGVYLLDQDTTDGNITVDGLTISVNIPAADIGAAGIEEGGEYDFSLTIGDPIDGNRIQADFFAVQETGQVPVGCGSYEVGLAEVSLTINLVAGEQGVQGEQGIPGDGYVGSFRQISTSDTILPTDSTVEIIAGGNNISIALPDPADLFSDGTTKQGRVYRGADDTGDVAITGSGSDLFGGALFPGESFAYESNGTSLLRG